jgi:hypothetical protein
LDTKQSEMKPVRLTAECCALKDTGCHRGITVKVVTKILGWESEGEMGQADIEWAKGWINGDYGTIQISKTMALCRI